MYSYQQPVTENCTMKCVSCQEQYETKNAGTCKMCYEEASENKEELKREIDDLKAKVDFLSFYHKHSHSPLSSCFADILLVASDDVSVKGSPDFLPVSAHKAVLADRSPVFRAMFDNEMEESRSGTIKITNVSYEVLRGFVNYLYTAEVSCLDETMALELIILAEKYQVKHLKTYCENFMVTKLNWESSVMNYAFAHRHNAKHLLEASLSFITDNMDKLTKQEDYMELVEMDPRLVVEIYEACLSKQVNTAANKDSSVKPEGKVYIG